MSTLQYDLLVVSLVTFLPSTETGTADEGLAGSLEVSMVLEEIAVAGVSSFSAAVEISGFSGRLDLAARASTLPGISFFDEAASSAARGFTLSGICFSSR